MALSTKKRSFDSLSASDGSSMRSISDRPDSPEGSVSVIASVISARKHRVLAPSQRSLNNVSVRRSSRGVSSSPLNVDANSVKRKVDGELRELLKDLSAEFQITSKIEYDYNESTTSKLSIAASTSTSSTTSPSPSSSAATTTTPSSPANAAATTTWMSSKRSIELTTAQGLPPSPVVATVWTSAISLLRTPSAFLRGGVAQDMVLRVKNISLLVPPPTAQERFYITRLLFLVSSCARLEELAGALKDSIKLSPTEALLRGPGESPENSPPASPQASPRSPSKSASISPVASPIRPSTAPPPLTSLPPAALDHFHHHQHHQHHSKHPLEHGTSSTRVANVSSSPAATAATPSSSASTPNHQHQPHGNAANAASATTPPLSGSSTPTTPLNKATPNRAIAEILHDDDARHLISPLPPRRTHTRQRSLRSMELQSILASVVAGPAVTPVALQDTSPPVMCRICERNVPVLSLADHSSLCVQHHKWDIKSLEINEMLRKLIYDQRNEIPTLALDDIEFFTQVIDIVEATIKVNGLGAYDQLNKLLERVATLRKRERGDSPRLRDIGSPSMTSLGFFEPSTPSPASSLSPSPSPSSASSSVIDSGAESNESSPAPVTRARANSATTRKVESMEVLLGRKRPSLSKKPSARVQLLASVAKLITRKKAVMRNLIDTFDCITNDIPETLHLLKIPSIAEFEILKPITRGGFACVYLAQKKSTKDVLAIKVLKQQDLVEKNQVEQVIAERNILATTSCDYVVRLYYAFKTKENLCLAMEFLSGGDLCAPLIEIGAFDEQVAKWYIAEIVQALEYLHSKKIIHRDLKPDNILIANDGHLKLTDFGLSHFGLHRQTQEFWGKIEDSGKSFKFLRTNSVEVQEERVVGTPDYLAPEVLLGLPHGKLVDFWALGVILYEFLVGYPPFSGSSPAEIFQNILNTNYTISWDELSDEDISPAAADLVRRLLCDADKRLGSNSIEEIKQHPFFENINWETLRSRAPPFKPNPADVTDTKFFEARKAFWPLIEEDFGFVTQANNGDGKDDGKDDDKEDGNGQSDGSASASSSNGHESQADDDAVPPTSSDTASASLSVAASPAATQTAISPRGAAQAVPTSPLALSSAAPAGRLSLDVSNIVETKRKELLARVSSSLDEGAFGSFWCINANNLHQRNLEIVQEWKAAQEATPQ